MSAMDVAPPVNLAENERILWSGQPEPKAFKLQEYFAVVFGVMVVLLSFFALRAVVADSIHSTLTGIYFVAAMAFEALIFVPLLLLGAYACTVPLRNYNRAKNTHFFITNTRALVVNEWRKKKREQSCEIVKTLKLTQIAGPRGTGSIVFDEIPVQLAQSLPYYRLVEGNLLTLTLVFFDLQDVDEVRSLLDSLIEEKSSSEARTLYEYTAAQTAVPGSAITPLKPSFMGSMYKIRMTMLGLLVLMVFVPAAGMAVLYVMSQPPPLFGYMDDSGKIVIQPQFSEAGNFSQGLARVMPAKKSNWGFIDHTGKVVIPPTFAQAQDFSDGLAAVLDGDKWGFIDKTGAWKIPAKYMSAGNFADGVVPVYSFETDANSCAKGQLIDKQGKVLMDVKNFGMSNTNDDRPMQFTEGLLCVMNDKALCGYVNTKGKFVIAPAFDNARAFSQGVAAACKDNKWGLIDKHGAWLLKPQYEDVLYSGEGLVPVKIGGKWGFVNKQGAQVIKPQFDSAEPFSESVAHVRLNKRNMLIQKNGGTTLKVTDCMDRHEGLVAASH
jgi:hypothetical protein